MRRFLINGSLCGSFIVFCLTIGLFEHFLMFILFGVLPGSNTPVAASMMLAVWILLFIGTANYWIVRPLRKFHLKNVFTRQDQPA